MDFGLEECYLEGYIPAFLPEIIDLLISTPSTDTIMRENISSLSLLAMGGTPQGNKVVVCAHVPHYLSNAYDLRTALKWHYYNPNHPYHNLMAVSTNEFKRLLSLEDGKTVFVKDLSLVLPWDNIDVCRLITPTEKFMA